MCSLKSNLENLQTHLLNELDFHFNIIGVTETRITNSNFIDFNPNITAGYNFEYVPTPPSAGGVGMYIDSDFKYEVLEKTSNEAFQALWVEIHFTNAANIICGVIYRQHNSPEIFLKYFEETVENLSISGKPIYIMSDTNLNLLHCNSCNYVQDFLFTSQSLNLTPTIDKPTRGHRNSATLTDNNFTNKVAENIISGNLISDVSDHFTQFCISQSPISKEKPARLLSQDFSNFTERNFINDLLLINWDHSVPDNETNVNKLFLSFYNKLNKIVNKHAPFKSTSRRKAKCFSKQWITTGIRKSIQTKNKLLSGGNSATYKLYRNKILTLMRLSKKLYFYNYFQGNTNNLKWTWKGINDLIHRKTKHTKIITKMKHSQTQEISHAPLVNANILNSHFASVGNRLASELPNSNRHFSDYLPRTTYSGSFVFETVLPSEIELEIIMALLWFDFSFWFNFF